MKKIAVIGAGYLGRHHARIYSSLEGAELAAVVDVDGTRAGEVAANCNSKAYTNFRDVLALVDALSIVTPTETHATIAMECLRKGKDVFIEKPITGALAEADLVIKEAEERGLVLQVGHIERFNPAAEELFSVLKNAHFIEAERASPYLGRAMDVDVTLDLMIHDIDIALSVLGCPAAVNIKAIGASLITDKLDYAKAWVEFENGTGALFTASRVAASKRRVMNVLEKDRFVEIDFISRKLLARGPSGEHTFQAEDREPLKEELKSFLACINERGVPRVKPQEARQALALALQISEIARNGMAVNK
jgi:predicted dehydrogenase